MFILMLFMLIDRVRSCAGVVLYFPVPVHLAIFGARRTLDDYDFPHSPSGTTSPQPQLSNMSWVRWLVLILQCLDRANTGSLNTEQDSSGGGGA